MPSRRASRRVIGSAARSRAGVSAGRTSRSRPVASMWSSIRASSRREPLVGGGRGVAAGRRRTSGASPSTPVSRPVRRTPSRCERGEVDVAVVVAADELQRAFVARLGRVAHLVDRPSRTCRSGRATTRCPCPGSGEAPGCDGRRPARRRGRRGRARRRSAPRWRRRRRRAPARPGSRSGLAVGARGDLGDRRIEAVARSRARAGWSHQPVAITTLRAAHVVSEVRTVKPSSARDELADVVSFLDRRVERPGVGREVGGQLGGGHEAVGIGAPVATIRGAGWPSSG